MKVGIIGSGAVAQTLGAGFAKHGHEVMLGTREPGKLKDFASANPNVKVGDVREAARFAQLAVLSVKGTAAMQALGAVAGDLKGKTVIDTTNPIADAPPTHGVLAYFTGPNDSLGEQLQKAYPELRIVKAFNSVGNACMINPDFGETPTMFICGNDAMAKNEVTAILDQFGWDTADMGMIEASRAIEPLCQLWCIPGMLANDWRHAYRLLQ